MSSIYDWQKQSDAINRISDMLNFFSSQMNSANRFGGMSSMQNMMVNYDFSAITKVHDYFKFTNAIQNALSNFDWSNSIHISDILKEVTEQYIQDNELDETVSEEIREVVASKDGKLLSEKQRKIWQMYIYPLLVSLLFFILSSNQSQQVATNTITEVNNYYTVEVGMNVNTLNDYNFHMICKDNVMPRIKPDCSSRVVGHLTMGKIVCVVGKYKKWMEIIWKNDEGEYFSGWIQNYKIVGFK